MTASPEPKSISEIHATYGDRSAEWFDSNSVHAHVRGRIVSKRVMGKIAFVSIDDGSGELMLFLQRGDLETLRDAFENSRVGDILRVTGQLFRTKTRQLCIKAMEVTVEPQSRH